MTLYPLFVVVAAAAVSSPGPGVLLTLTNALRHGRRGTVGGILGIACGTVFVAALSATGLGVLLSVSALAFAVMKLLGAAYLIYLGIRLWRAPISRIAIDATPAGALRGRFVEGLVVQVSNPKAIIFFLSVFPQFIDPEAAFAPQFTALVLTYGALVVLIHGAYALTARRARGWLTSERGGTLLNRLSAAAFCFFGLSLAVARR